MVHQSIPSYREQANEDQSHTHDQSHVSDEQLPAYSAAETGQSPAYIREKAFSLQPLQQSKGPGKMSTIKSILTGDVHKHNPRYVLEESVTGQPSVARPTSSKPAESKRTQSTLRSILTGDVQKHHPMYRLEESMDERLQGRK
ncbi:hypothetical protein LTR10_010742 [Elasticomyces elasticus]|nr:hypothetical protein LTR10_010742 [Elasticomyces elasticus]KAK4968348.1 hypothetical protein LTR42_009631 [Elasticomyces elasticus]